MSSKARRSTTRKVVGSLAIAGTAAAVAGLGTFGTFTDSTTPVATTVQTGTLDINLNAPAGGASIPAAVASARSTAATSRRRRSARFSSVWSFPRMRMHRVRWRNCRALRTRRAR